MYHSDTLSIFIYDLFSRISLLAWTAKLFIYQYLNFFYCDTLQEVIILQYNYVSKTIKKKKLLLIFWEWNLVVFNQVFFTLFDTTPDQSFFWWKKIFLFYHFYSKNHWSQSSLKAKLLKHERSFFKKSLIKKVF